MKTYKIKDLPKDFNLVGCKLGEQFIVSGWKKGFWVSDSYEDYKSGKKSQVFPVFFKSFDDIKDWTIEVPLERSLELLKAN